MYKIRISTDAYKPRRCSKENWEPGTTNSFMDAINGWHTKEQNLQAVRWRIELFLSGIPNDISEQKCKDWYHQLKNRLEYHDMPCNVMRTEYIECPGFHQGYCDIDKLIVKLKESGKIRIPFSAAYDSRQYLKNMDGCFMEITKC